MNFKRGGSQIDSPVWIKNKKATINPKYEDDKCIQYAGTVALNYNEVEYNQKRFSNIVPCIGTCNWHRINFQQN